MDKPKLCDLLGARYYGTFWVRDVRMQDWGSDLVLDCSYEPGEPDAPIPFRLTLHDCREIQWRVYAHLKHPEDTTLPAELVNVALGAGNHHKPLNLLTDSFGLTVLYGELQVLKTG
ncbi:MAG: hypothetical protein HZC41_24250 [Chloroflexi bacterium]|nr:hypothetical protein [Chloroflexota bacterium]